MAKKKIKPGYVQIAVRLPVEVRDRINRAAAAVGCSVNAVLSAFADKWSASIEDEQAVESAPRDNKSSNSKAS